MSEGNVYRVMVGSYLVNSNCNEEFDIKLDELIKEGFEPYTNLQVDNVYDFKNERYVFQYYQIFIKKERDVPLGKTPF